MNYTVSIHIRHDANMTISNKSGILEYVEFEKIAKQRHFKFSTSQDFEREFEEMIRPYLLPYWDDISKINVCWLSESQKAIIVEIFNAKEICEKKHHISHAFSLYAFTKKRENDLIISYDGGGDDDDFFKLFYWRDQEIQLLKEVKLNLGTPYRLLGLISSEIKSEPIFEYETNMNLPGKVMGLAPFGQIRHSYIDPIKDFYKQFNRKNHSIYNTIQDLLENISVKYDHHLQTDKNIARDILRTSQHVFETLFFENTSEMNDQNFERILVTGGCSLNIKTNTEIFNRTQKEIFASPVPGDCGISIGAAISDMNIQDVQPFRNSFIGIAPQMNMILDSDEHTIRGITLKELARRISQGHIVATLTNRMEAGPRSLGGRSILAAPMQNGIKNKLNTIKDREFFRPVAVMVTKNSQSLYFENSPESKYMSFSPLVNSEWRDTLKEITHYDGTCRIQTVDENDGFIYELLLEVGKQTGYELLINTSFNAKGRPIINSLTDAMDLLKTTDINCLYFEGKLIEK